MTPADLTRPRSVRAHQAVLDATRELLAEGGLVAATTDAIAARSKVSKATIYNHWPSRGAIAAEAFGLAMAQALPRPRTASALGDLREHMRRLAAFYASDQGRIFAQLLAAGVTDEHSASFFADFFLAGRRAIMRELWEAAQAEGAVRGDVDADLATDLLAGPLVFRLMSGHAPLTPRACGEVIDATFAGLLA